MNRVKIFSAPHKALRKLLGDFSLAAGRADTGNPEAIEQLKKQGEELFFLLTLHAESEDDIILRALEQKVPGGAAENTAEHEALEAEQQHLHDRLRSLSADSSAEDLYRFYLDFSAYHAQYLLHILHEENETQQLLEAHFSDAELLDIRSEIVQHLAFEDYLLWLRHMFATHTQAEFSQMLQGLKRVLPAEAFEQVCDTVGLEAPVVAGVWGRFAPPGRFDFSVLRR
ncbi:MAG: hypothetical protein EP344_05235 [Bacteroidetes bacterium]|nr:MAG: hypothetical protein EP344_05235 [Bacteroidota bacterium]